MYIVINIKMCVYFVSLCPFLCQAISGSLKNVLEEYRRGGPDTLEQTDSNGFTALHFGSLSGNADVVRELVRLGADANYRSCGMGGVTPIIVATSKNHIEVVKVLLEVGSDPSCARTRDGMTPIHICSENNFSEIAKLLLDHTPSLAQARDHKGYTCMDIARRKKSTDFINVVLNLNSVPRLTTRSSFRGSSDSHLSPPPSGQDVSGGIVPVGGGFKKERKSASDYSPTLMQSMFDAARAGDCSGLEAACRGGAEDASEVVNAQQRSGWTVLMEAAAVGRHQAVRTLIGLGADLEARNKKGMTALHIAVRYGYVQTVRALLEGGASPDAVTRKGDTIEELAASYKHLTLLAYLVNRRATRTPQSPSTPPTASAVAAVDQNTPPTSAPEEVEHALPLPKGQRDKQIDTAPTARENLRHWLSEISLGQYYAVLQSNGFEDLSSLSVLTDEDMASLGMLLGHRRIFRLELVKLQEHHPSLFVPKSLSFAPLSAPESAHHGGRGRSAPPSRHARASSTGCSRRRGSRKKQHAKEKALASLSQPRANDSMDSVLLDADMSQLERATSAPPGSSSHSDPSISNYVSANTMASDPGPSCVVSRSSRGESTSDLSGVTDSSRDGPDGYSLEGVEEETKGEGDMLYIGKGVKRLEFSEIEIGAVVGEGSFGTVRSGWWRGMHVAVKALRVNDIGDHSDENGEPLGSGRHALSSSQAKEMLQEAETMARVCNHSFVIQFIGVVLDPVPSVVTLFCDNGSVENLILKNPGNIPDHDTLLRFALETAMGVRHLHLEGIIHRDLATRNLLIDETFHIRVADFGFARVKDAAASKGYTNSTMGPVRWSAPEAMRRRRYSESSDVFSFGVVLYELFVQSIPWPGYDTLDVAVRVCGGERMDIPPKVPLDVTDLMILCWSHEEAQRPTLNEVIDSIQFMREDAALIERENRELMWMLNGVGEKCGGDGSGGMGDDQDLCTNTDIGGNEDCSAASYEDMLASYGVTHDALFESSV